MRALLAIAVTFLLVGADAPADAIKKDIASLEGEWSMVSGEREGMAIPEEYVKTGKRVFKDGVVTVSFGDMVFLKAKVTVDPGKKPKAIDYEVTEGTLKGQKQYGIYELDGDKVKFCFSAADKERPADFISKEGSGRIVSVWKREKK